MWIPKHMVENLEYYCLANRTGFQACSTELLQWWRHSVTELSLWLREHYCNQYTKITAILVSCQPSWTLFIQLVGVVITENISRRNKSQRIKLETINTWEYSINYPLTMGWINMKYHLLSLHSLSVYTYRVLLWILDSDKLWWSRQTHSGWISTFRIGNNPQIPVNLSNIT